MNSQIPKSLHAAEQEPYLFFPFTTVSGPFNLSPAPVAELRAFPVSITYPVGEAITTHPGYSQWGRPSACPSCALLR